MYLIKKFVIMVLVSLVTFPAVVLAASDLTGVWDSEVGRLEIWQDGSDLRAKQKDVQLEEALGEFMFLAEVDGGNVKGKVATGIFEKKAECGDDWAAWVPLELSVSSDGNRLEGKWFRGTHNTKAQGCPITSAEWKPIVFTRNLSIPMSDAPPLSGKKTLIAALVLLGLALVFFFIRNAYVNYLVGSLKRSPNNAGLAGWGLFGGLLFGSAIGCVAIAGKSMLTIPVISGLAALSLACFILCFIISSKK
jgi:hypothetical protein